MYGSGEGVPQDLVLAHMWLNLGAAWSGNRNDYARQLRDDMARYMSAGQIAEAQRLAREWKPAER
jgi:hypothetical protein